MAGDGRHSMIKIIMQVLGYGFLTLGVLGLFLPVLQGILFLAIGLILLSRSAGWASRLLDRIKERYPKFALTIGKAEKFAERIENRCARFLGKT